MRFTIPFTSLQLDKKSRASSAKLHRVSTRSSNIRTKKALFAPQTQIDRSWTSHELASQSKRRWKTNEKDTFIRRRERGSPWKIARSLTRSCAVRRRLLRSSPRPDELTRCPSTTASFSRERSFARDCLLFALPFFVLFCFVAIVRDRACENRRRVAIFLFILAFSFVFLSAVVEIESNWIEKKVHTNWKLQKLKAIMKKPHKLWKCVWVCTQQVRKLIWQANQEEEAEKNANTRNWRGKVLEEATQQKRTRSEAKRWGSVQLQPKRRRRSPQNWRCAYLLCIATSNSVCAYACVKKNQFVAFFNVEEFENGATITHTATREAEATADIRGKQKNQQWELGCYYWL